MSERKVLNKYYPPDFDPTKIPKLKGPRNKTFNIRIMAPFNMRCNTCGEYIYKGKKFNSRKETVEDEDYLGLHIHRFYIKCPRCVAEIAFKTDPENTDYALEAGATRNFEAAKTAMAQAIKAQKEKEEEELNNPMKVLENRTKASRNEMERIENLEELRELNARHAAVDHETMLRHAVYEEQLRRLQEEEDEQMVRQAFGKETCKRLADDSDDDDSPGPSRAKIPNLDKASDLLLETPAPSEAATTQLIHPSSTSSKSVSSTKPRDSLRMLVKPKQSALKGLVVKKKPATGEKTVESNKSAGTAPVPKDSDEKSSGKNIENQDSDVPKTGSEGKGALSLLGGGYSEKADSDDNNSKDQKTGSAKGALSLLGNYSESDESD